MRHGQSNLAKQHTYLPNDQVAAQEQLLERMMRTNKDLKKQVKALDEEEHELFENLRTKLELEYPIKDLLNAKEGSREAQYVKAHQEAEIKSKTLESVN